jgi:hypothetical protein
MKSSREIFIQKKSLRLSFDWKEKACRNMATKRYEIWLRKKAANYFFYIRVPFYMIFILRPPPPNMLAHLYPITFRFLHPLSSEVRGGGGGGGEWVQSWGHQTTREKRPWGEGDSPLGTVEEEINC